MAFAWATATVDGASCCGVQHERYGVEELREGALARFDTSCVVECCAVLFEESIRLVADGGGHGVVEVRLAQQLDDVADDVHYEGALEMPGGGEYSLGKVGD